MRGAALRGERGAVSAPGSAPAAGRLLGPCAGVAAVERCTSRRREYPGGGLRGARRWSLFPAAWRGALGGCCAHFLGPHGARVPLSVCCVVTGACAPLEAPARPRGPAWAARAWGLNFSRVPRGPQRISLFCCLTVGAQARFLNLKGSPVKSACRLN